MFGPVLKGQKVTLRPPDETDAARFVEWLADQEVTRYLGVVVNVPSIEAEKEFLRKTGEAKDAVFWAIEAEGKTIGTTVIRSIDWISGNGNTGILIGDKTCWGKGYASEAMALRTEYAFRQLNLHKLSSAASMENEPSKRALMKNGYKQIGIEREHAWREGRWHDHWLAEVLRSDWDEQQTG